jgi:hypothetical protein
MAEGNDYPGIPRWVKISWLVVSLLLLLTAIIVAFDIGGPHGPGRHMSPNSEMQPAGDGP